MQAADEIRLLATKALLGLTHDSQIAQILERLRISLVLSEIVRGGPVLERSSEHYAELRMVATALIARITGRPTSTVSHSDAMDPASWRLERAGIVARTPITYDNKELLMLVRDHLLRHGLDKTAETLELEGGLVEAEGEGGGEPRGIKRARVENVLSSVGKRSSSASTSPFWRSNSWTPSTAGVGNSNNLSNGNTNTISNTGTRVSLPPPPQLMVNTSSSTMNVHPRPPTTPDVRTKERLSLISTPGAPLHPSYVDLLFSPLSNRQPSFPNPNHSGGSDAVSNHPTPHFRRTKAWQKQVIMSPSLLDPPPPTSGILESSNVTGPEEGGELVVAGLQKKLGSGSSGGITLDDIVVQYLRKQHEQCSDPICCLPAFSLTTPHR